MTELVATADSRPTSKSTCLLLHSTQCSGMLWGKMSALLQVFHPPLTCELDSNILKLLHWGQQVVLNPVVDSAHFTLRTIPSDTEVLISID